MKQNVNNEFIARFGKQTETDLHERHVTPLHLHYI